MKQVITWCSFIIALAMALLPLQLKPSVKSYWGDKAIGSHDTVAYHDPQVRQTHQQIQGKATFIVKYLDANWYFASQASADKFFCKPRKIPSSIQWTLCQRAKLR